MALLNGRPGILVSDFLERKRKEGLVHGNELLVWTNPVYPEQATYGVREHTLENVLAALDNTQVLAPTGAPKGITNGGDAFVGYLLLDALIGNTDRHHQNWAVIRRTVPTRSVRLAPTYDHSSSLGRELDDQKRQHRLDGTGIRSLESYCSKAKTALYSADQQQMSPLAALAGARKLRPEAFGIWRQALVALEAEPLCEIVERVSPQRMSIIAKSFGNQILSYDRDQILKLQT